MRCILMAFIALGLLTFAACDDSDEPVNPVIPNDTTEDVTDALDTLLLTEFPHSLGDSWTYAVRDSSSTGTVIVDTVVVTIVDSIAYDCGGQDCSGTFQQVWQLRYSNTIDSLTVLYKHDSVYFYHPDALLSGLFPLTPHRCWAIPIYAGGDIWVSMTFTVTAVNTRQLGTQVVYGCMEVSGEWTTLGVQYYSTVEIAPNIGIGRMDVRQVIVVSDLPENRISWRLIDWDVD